jgi:hypothetical protein
VRLNPPIIILAFLVAVLAVVGHYHWRAVGLTMAAQQPLPNAQTCSPNICVRISNAKALIISYGPKRPILKTELDNAKFLMQYFELDTGVSLTKPDIINYDDACEYFRNQKVRIFYVIQIVKRNLGSHLSTVDDVLKYCNKTRDRRALISHTAYYFQDDTFDHPIRNYYLNIVDNDFGVLSTDHISSNTFFIVPKDRRPQYEQ